MLTQELRQRVKDEVVRYINLANDHYGLTLKVPSVDFTVRGRTAGYAYCDVRWAVNFNAVLLTENVERFIARTVPHEVAHLVDYAIRTMPDKGNLHARSVRFLAQGQSGRKREIHGDSWRTVMQFFGVKDISRCHTYDTTNSRVRTKERKRFNYACGGCGRVVALGPKYHAAIQKGNPRGLRLRCCSVHFKPDHYRGPLVPVLKTAVPPAPTSMPKAAQQATASAGPMSKADQALAIVRAHKDVSSRDEIIRTIMQNCSMSRAGAQTYYYNAVKRLSSG